MNQKRIALVAHDHKKAELVEWAKLNRERIAEFEIYATGTTGHLLERELHIKVNRLQSGPLGGDQQLGALIADGKIDMLIFFWDPLQPLPHDPDIKALLRLAVLWNIPMACNRTTADYIFSSSLMSGGYKPNVPDFSDYLARKV